MKADRDFRIPVCSTCGTQAQRNDKGDLFCPNCADEWLKSYVEAKTRDHSVGGVALPAGVTDARRAEQAPSFQDVLGNRRARRAMRRAR